MYNANDFLTLRLKYRENNEVLKLIEALETANEVNDRIEELEDEISDLQTKIEDLETEVEGLRNELL